jgi:hypothetical protein
MPRKPGLGRYFVSALEAPVVLALVVGAALSRVLLSVGQAAQAVTRLSAALIAAHEQGRQRSEAARAVTVAGHQH